MPPRHYDPEKIDLTRRDFYIYEAEALALAPAFFAIEVGVFPMNMSATDEGGADDSVTAKLKLPAVKV